MTDAPAPPPGDIRAELRLRPEQPRVTRLSRKVFITLGGVSAVAIMAALFWALDANRRASQSPAELGARANLHRHHATRHGATVLRLRPALPVREVPARLIIATNNASGSIFANVTPIHLRLPHVESGTRNRHLVARDGLCDRHLPLGRRPRASPNSTPSTRPHRSQSVFWAYPSEYFLNYDLRVAIPRS